MLGNHFNNSSRVRGKRNLMDFQRPVVVRSKEQNNSISMDRYKYMRAAGMAGQPLDDSVLVRNLGAPLLPGLTNGQPPAGGAMAPMPAPVPPQTQGQGQPQTGGTRPGQGTGGSQPATQPAAPAAQTVPEFRPVQPGR